MNRRFLLHLKNIDLIFPHRTCFTGFSANVYDGERIAVIGQNGSGKSSLLKILHGELDASGGESKIPPNVRISYVPQVVQNFETLSGAQRLNKALTQALALNPDVLLLDEPTNHLDLHNRTALMRMLRAYGGALIVVSHDVELLQSCVDTLWHIEQEKIHVFTGGYNDYRREIEMKHTSISREISVLHTREKEAHKRLMKEQQRGAKRKANEKKKYDGDKLTLRAAQSRGQATGNKNSKRITDDKNSALAALSGLQLPEVIKPKFSLNQIDRGYKTLVAVNEGSVAYAGDNLPIVAGINFSITGSDRIAIAGDNGSGKSTLMKAIHKDASITKSGVWHVPRPQDMGYLDQHYQTLAPDKNVLETLQELVPHWSHAELRKRLNDFLFRKNGQINTPISKLSGGEKARLCLACISVQTPKLLLLDEISNNLDLIAREHVIQVLQEYPGAFIIISHDEDFLQRIGVTTRYLVKDGGLRPFVAKSFRK